MDLFEFAEKKKEKQKAELKTAATYPSYAMPQAPYQKDGDNTVLTVSELSHHLRMMIEGVFAQVIVEGEVSGLRRAASGHVYFDLKDKDNLIKCILWRGTAEKLTGNLEDGQQITVHGKVTTYGARSTYQITVNRVEFSGVGALMQKFEQLKAQLAEEGLFDASLKKKIPFIPEKIAIITSPTGAVIDDMLHRIEDRFPRHVQLYPVLVQGVGAKEQLAEGLDYFSKLNSQEQPDVIIVARGGGSLEDLWAFNEEIVVRAIARCSIPVISAVGHEPDVTLCDYVADLRAPTPTAAAEMVVPVRTDLLYTLSLYESKLNTSMLNVLNHLRKNVALLNRSLPDPSSTLNQMRMRLEDKYERFELAMRHKLTHMQQQLMLQEKLLESYSPKGPLKRGYVYMTLESGKVLRSKLSGDEGDSAIAHFEDGERQIILGKSQ